MSIKSDKWIKEMAQNHKMIEPYESGQVSVTTGSTSGIKSERGAKLLQRLGHNPIGMIMERSWYNGWFMRWWRT